MWETQCYIWRIPSKSYVITNFWQLEDVKFKIKIKKFMVVYGKTLQFVGCFLQFFLIIIIWPGCCPLCFSCFLSSIELFACPNFVELGYWFLWSFPACSCWFKWFLQRRCALSRQWILCPQNDWIFVVKYICIILFVLDRKDNVMIMGCHSTLPLFFKEFTT